MNMPFQPLRRAQIKTAEIDGMAATLFRPMGANGVYGPHRRL